jgi:tryptophan synthase alpha chain
MNRIEKRFAELKSRGRTGIIAYLTVGFPKLDSTPEIANAIVEAGADMLELGIPFSDPLADGATIQRTNHAALQNGVTLGKCLEVCSQLRKQLPETPLILMGYYNPILAMGLETFAARAAAAGADGIIVPDLPPDEAKPLLEVARPKGLDVIFLIAPTSTEHRIIEVAKASSGFIYCVSLTGVTGARADLAAGLPEFLQRVRKHTSLPLAVGFGVSTSEHVRTVGQHAEAVIVGSALMQAIESVGPAGAAKAAQEFIAAMSKGSPRSEARARS